MEESLLAYRVFSVHCIYLVQIQHLHASDITLVAVKLIIFLVIIENSVRSATLPPEKGKFTTTHPSSESKQSGGKRNKGKEEMH